MLTLRFPIACYRSTVPLRQRFNVVGNNLQPRATAALRLEITAPARLSADSAQALMAFVLAGCGVALLPLWLVQTALDSHRLIHLLPEYRFAQQGGYAVYADAQHQPAKVRAFVDFLRARLA
ncbi:hypothetical protein BBB57_19440 [Kosakonia sacchari]|nr:hypothetical protein C813_20185 [Kosakonia sacchari SP1]ANR80231.1 hypothetical protein BBB57_19440 [Kosakonia sacchari]